MTEKLYRIDQITDNLDNRRKPLNNIERKKISNKGLYPYYGANNLMDYVDEYIFDEDIICIAEDGGSWGRNEKCSYIVNEKCWVNNHAHVLRVKENLDIKYLYYYLNHNDLNKYITGTTRGKLTQSALNSIEILLPDKRLQSRIVTILDKAQELIDKRKEQIEALDELVKSKFIEMFGDLKNEEKLSLEKCATFIDYRGKTPTLSENGIRIINAKSVGNGFFKYIDEYISEETYSSWMKRGFPIAGDVLFVTEGHTFGNVCRIPSDLKKFAMGQRVITMQGKDNLLNNTFLAQYMQSMSFKIDIDKYKTGSSAQGIRSKELQKIIIPIPKIDLQNQFADFVKQSDKLKFEMESSLKELEDNFNALMQRAFKGELFK